MNNSLVDDMEVLPVTAALSTIRVSLGVFWAAWLKYLLSSCFGLKYHDDFFLTFAKSLNSTRAWRVSYDIVNRHANDKFNIL